MAHYEGTLATSFCGWASRHSTEVYSVKIREVFDNYFICYSRLKGQKAYVMSSGNFVPVCHLLGFKAYSNLIALNSKLITISSETQRLSNDNPLLLGIKMIITRYK